MKEKSTTVQVLGDLAVLSVPFSVNHPYQARCF